MTKTIKNRYHHGDLRNTLLVKAESLLEEVGPSGLSLRFLAEHVGVSRTALYHHFANKHDLLCAIAENGFIRWQDQASQLFGQTDMSGRAKFARYFKGYIDYATTHPELYELMFGRLIWKNQAPTDTLKDVAYPNFQYQVRIFQMWQEQGIISSHHEALRLAQITWGTMHGIAKLLIDGIYPNLNHVEEMCECVIDILTQTKH